MRSADASQVLARVQHVRGLASIAQGRHDAAWEHLRRAFARTDPAFHSFLRCWMIGDLAEAAVHSGNHAAARVLLKELEPLFAQTPAASLQVGAHYARALLAEGEHTEELFETALQLNLSLWPFSRARLQLAYGAWLRRQRRVAESRVPLRAAQATFDAEPWSERARQELRASGETSRRRTPQARDQLSPQERQIARMAAEGLSNREIGQQLYLSHRTVGYHLYRIFPKLGIASRLHLATALAAADSPA